ncbi:MAG: flagellin [Saccharospirillum sp.]|uniref:flagellin N-terminal helical domain-containing protein n=1 Tax=Saccharospirillum sp. TaxID=2033801 RepID=UPI0032976BCB
MAQIINTNIASLNAQRNLNTSQSANSTALERLSSGLRINSAKDDAAGLAISTKFESQTRGLNQAIRNAGDGISLAQTAEGALGSMTDNLQRVRELAVQSANATNSDEDRVALQQEVSALVAEITRTADETNFNGRNLFDGNFNGTFQIGANAGQTVDVQIGELTAGRLGASDQVGVSAIGTDSAIGNGDLVINGVSIGASQAGDDTASTSNASASAIAKVETINRYTEETGVKAFVNENEVAGAEMTAPAASTSGEITINGVAIDLSVSTDTAQTRAGVAQAINAVSEQTGVTAIAGDSDSEGVTLVAADGRNVQIDLGSLTSAQTGLAATDTYEGGYTLVATGDTREIEISGGNGTGIGDLANAGLVKGNYSRAVATSVGETQSLVSPSQSLALDGTFTQTVDATDGTAIQFTNNLAIQASIGTDQYSTTVTGTGSGGTGSVAELAAGLNDIDGSGNVQAWEQIDATLSNLSLDDTDAAALSIGGVDVVLTGTTAASFVDDINSTDFSAGGLSVSASLNADGEVDLSMKNYSGAQVAFVGGTASTFSVDVDGNSADVDVVGSDADGVFVAGDVEFRTLDGKDLAVTLANIGDGAGTAPTAGEAQEVLSTGNTAISADYSGVNGLDDGDVTLNGVTIGAAQTTADRASATVASDGSTILSSSKELSAIAIAASINDVSDETGVTAAINATEVVGGDGSNLDVSQYAIGDSADLFINGVNLGTVTLQNDGSGEIDTDKAKADALSLINAKADQTGVTAVDNGVSLTLTGADGRNVSVAINNNSETNTGAGGSSIGALFGLDASVDGIGEAKFGEVATSQGAGPVGSVVSISGVNAGAYDYSGGGTETFSLTITDDTGANDVIALTGNYADADALAAAIQGASSNVGFTAVWNADTNAIDITSTSTAEGSQLTISAITDDIDGGGTAGTGLAAASGTVATGLADISGIEAQTYETTYGTVKLESATEINIGVGSKGSDEVEALGFRTGSYGGGEDGQFLKDVDISTFEGAQAAITAIDNALETVASQRAELGALQNRFESTVSNLAITAENLTAANSRIRDADFAAETAELSRTQVLQQAGISILAQANQRPQQVLSLLG